ncbi:MAG: uroporphyrinogen-III synthase, partial [Thermoplasmatota archaeon]
GCGLALGASAEFVASEWRIVATLGDDDWFAKDEPRVRRASVTGPHAESLVAVAAERVRCNGAPPPLIERLAPMARDAPGAVSPAIQNLAGKRVLLTFDDLNGARYLRALAAAGATADVWPLVRHETMVPDLDAVAKEWTRAAWLLVASARAVPAVAALRAVAGDALAGSTRVGVVGASTARAMRAQGFPVHLVSPDGTGAGLAALAARWVPPTVEADVALLPGAAEPLAGARVTLKAAGFRVLELPVYRSVAAAPRPEPSFEPDAIVVTAPSAASALPPTKARLVAIGSTTAAALAERGIEVAATALRPTPSGVLEALAEVFR